MNVLSRIEEYLEPYFSMLPQLSKDTRRLLANIWPWLSLFVGVMQIFSAWWLFLWIQKLDMYTNVTKKIISTYGDANYITSVSIFAWIATISLLLNGVILFIALPKLLKKRLTGWRLVFLAVLINLIYGLASTFIEGRGGAINIFGALLGSGITVYLLFQIREYYGGKEFKSISSKKVKIDKDSSKTKSGSNADSVTKKEKTQ